MSIRSSFIAGFIILAANSAHAACSVAADPNASVRALSAAVPAEAQLLVSVTLLPKMMHVDYAAAAKRPACDLGQIAAGDAGYELWGDDKAWNPRVGLPIKSGAPIALILPISDIRAMIAASGRANPLPLQGISSPPSANPISQGGVFTPGCPTRRC